MTQYQSLDQMSKEEILKEYHYLENNKSIILDEVSSNRISIHEQFINMEVIIANGLENIDDLIELDMALTRINTYMAMAMLNVVEDHEVEFKHLTRLPSLLFKLHLNKMCILKSIKIDGRFNQLTKLPAEIGFLQQLEVLDLNHCSIQVIPTEISLLKSLHNINFDYNEIDSIPIEICQLTNLEELHLRHNHVKDLPLALTRLARLRMIDIAENEITSLPAVFSQYIH